ncbi:MAG: hypothetical protein HYX78_08440 [Armatimonadetes bacterium]|nr:hypothetical protein [Armatimonadota bacterium]
MFRRTACLPTAAPQGTDNCVIVQYLLISGTKTDSTAAEAKPAPADEKDPLEKFSSLMEERMDAFAKMSPDEQRVAMEQDAIAVLNLPPEVREQYVSGMAQAIRSMDPVVRSQFRDMMRGMFGPRRCGGNREN